jgi:hypothetical protein
MDAALKRGVLEHSIPKSVEALPTNESWPAAILAIGLYAILRIGALGW